jgi:flagellar hook-associated protein 1 FlgK
MIGLNALLNLGARSLQTQSQGTEVVGNNIANVNNSAYTRQRVAIASSTPVATSIGDQGTGADATAIQQIRDSVLEQEIQAQSSVTNSLDAQQSALQKIEAALGQSLDQTSQSSDSSGDSTGTQHGLGDAINTFFTNLQTLANDPTSLSQRKVVLIQAQDLATRFNQVNANLTKVKDGLNTQLDNNLTKANDLLSEIANLNQQISDAKSRGGEPNDLIDTRTSKLQDLAALVKVDVADGTNGMVNVSVNGQALITDATRTDTLQTYDAGDGQMLVQTVTGGEPLTITGGSIQGIIDTRDGALADLSTSVNTLASKLISEVNTVHGTGFSLGGDTGLDFFEGDSAANIAVNSTLQSDPSKLQLSSSADAQGDNQVALALAQLVNKSITDLNNQTFSQNYTLMVTTLGQTAASVTSQISDQKVVTKMLTQQRTSISGVSLDEEMSSLLTYQKAYQASAKIVSTVNEMFDTVLQMKS